MNINMLMDKEIRDLIGKVRKYYSRSEKKNLFNISFGKDMIAKSITRSRFKNNIQIPPFLIASITSDCNLSCKGCYAKSEDGFGKMKNGTEMTVDEWSRIFCEADDLGVSFILLAGGEPSLRPDIIKKASEFKKILFPVFTNGTILDDKIVDLYRNNDNLIPVVSIEGDSTDTDARRGFDVSKRVDAGIDEFKNNGIMFGTSVTVTVENYKKVTSESFIRSLYDDGCGGVIFVEYVPVDGKSDSLVLTGENLKTMEENVRYLKDKYDDMIIISFPGDEEIMGGCLAAGKGFFHINPDGGAEPCPFSPYSKLNLKESTIAEVLQSDFFAQLRDITKNSHQHYGGCTLFNEKENVEKLVPNKE